MSAFDEVEQRFRAQQAAGAFPGGQLVVEREGKRLLDLAIGTTTRADDPAALPVSPDTRFQVMSASKPVVALAVALLVQRGQVELDAPLSRWIPELEREATRALTVRDVLTHRSGLTLPALGRAPERWSDPGEVRRAFREEAPTFPRGTLGYAPAAFGWLLGELVARVSGQALPEFTRAHFPPELHGLHWQVPGDATDLAATCWLGVRPFLLNGDDLSARFEETNNTIAARTALVPGAGMYASARSLAALYALLLRGGAARDGTPFLSAETVARFTTAQTRGLDRITGAYVVLAMGFSRGWLAPHAYGWWNTGSCFGHAGGFSVLAWGDQRSRTAIAITTNGNRSVPDLVKRFAPLGSAIRRAVG